MNPTKKLGKLSVKTKNKSKAPEKEASKEVKKLKKARIFKVSTFHH